MTQLTLDKTDLAQQIADDLIEQLDLYYSLPELYDNELDAQIHRWYCDAPNVYPKRPYFSPSAADACSRELYYKAIKAPKDSFRRQPHQGRWVEIGTHVGSIIQRTILAMERNLEDATGVSPRFRFERTEKGEPLFEEFSKRNTKITHKGKTFYLYGACDGVMEYTTEDGEKIRVGLEVKSKQGTPAKTTPYSMKHAEVKHVKQCYLYSEMFNLDYYVILYVNTAHKGWTLSAEDYKKNPDIRAFGFHITDEDREEVYDKLVSVLESVERKQPPTLDLNKFTFNNYKEAIAKDMSQEEFARIEDYARRVSYSSLPAPEKANVRRAYEQLKLLREAGE